MREVTCHLRGTTAYAQSRPYNVEKLPKERPDDYEERTWMHRAHTDADGQMVIPAMSIKNCLSECAKFLGMQIPGKGKSTFTKHFDVGILVMDDPPLGVNIKDVIRRKLFLPSDGKVGGGKRVWKSFPEIPAGWKAKVKVYICDDTITKPVFEEHMQQAGMFIGLGFWRPRNRGQIGRFEVTKFEWA